VKSWKLAALLAVLVVPVLTGRAQAGIINGDFQTGSLSPWTTYTLPGGTIGTPAVSIFETVLGAESLSAVLEAGQIFGWPGPGGGGIQQVFSHGGGDLVLSADVAVAYGSESWRPGVRFELILNGVSVDVLALGLPEPSEAVLRGVLSASVADVAAGDVEIRIEVTRATFGGDVRDYIDNVVARSTSIPEPATLALFGLGLAGILVIRRKKSAA
jgi:hypothetical protein